MAGLGETWPHVASLPLATAAGVERRESLTVTQKSAYWVIVPVIKVPQYQILSLQGKNEMELLPSLPRNQFPRNKYELLHHLTQKRWNSLVPWLSVQGLRLLLCCLIPRHTSLLH